jgi:Helix-turn-helix of DDE superfamily endonuclease
VRKIAHRMPPAASRPRGLPLPVRSLLVLTHMHTNLTTRALAALFATSQSSVDPIIGHLMPVLAAVLGPTADCSPHPWIIGATLIPVHDQSITAISKNYRRGVNTEILINANNRRVIAVGPCWPGNRNDVVVARRTVAHLLDGTPAPGS